MFEECERSLFRVVSQLLQIKESSEKDFEVLMSL